MSGAIYLPAQRNRRTARPTPDRNPLQHPEERTPEGEGRVPYLQCVQTVWRFIRVLPAGTSVQATDRISLCSCLGGGSWSGLPCLSYTSRGRKTKIRFLTSSPRRASWCLESRLTHHHGITPPLGMPFAFSNYSLCMRRTDRRTKKATHIAPFNSTHSLMRKDLTGHTGPNGHLHMPIIKL